MDSTAAWLDGHSSKPDNTDEQVSCVEMQIPCHYFGSPEQHLTLIPQPTNGAELHGRQSGEYADGYALNYKVCAQSRFLTFNTS